MGEHMHATCQLSREGLGVRKCDRAAGCAPDVRDRKRGARALRFKEAYKGTIACRRRFAKEGHIVVLVEGGAPAVAIPAGAPAMGC